MSIRIFLSELKRRQVYRAVIVYATIAWVFLEGADIVFPRLGFADESVTLVLILALVGFPIAVYLAWVYDITPEGIFRTPPLKPGEHHHFSAARIAEFLLIGALVAVVGYLYFDRLAVRKQLAESSSVSGVEIETSDPARYRAIAVLPFADMSEAGDQAWFAEGIAEELLHALASINELRVMARTSSFAFKDTDKTVAEIAEILGVQAVLEGSVRRTKDRVRVTAQLVDAHSGFHIWSGSYERQITDIFKLQDELAKSVVEALQIELRVDPSARLVAEQTREPEAYNWFIRGRAAYEWANPQSTPLSIRYFEKAVEADPDYALAWGYLSLSRFVLMMFRPFDEIGASISVAVEHALALDPEQSEALAVKAVMTQLLERDWETAGRLYQRAVASNENQQALSMYAIFYLQFIDQQRKAIELYANFSKHDPLHAGYKANLASIIYWAGDFDGAIREALEALQLDPGHLVAIEYLIPAYTDKKDTAALASMLDSLPPAVLALAEIKPLVARSYAIRGDEARARKIYHELITSSDNLTPLALMNTAWLATTMGEIEESVKLLERVEKGGSWLQFWSKLLPMENSAIRKNPRYQALLKRMGLDDESVAALHQKLSFQ
jgi:TolB-like protein/Tfp pilus assembly protein PilF